MGLEDLYLDEIPADTIAAATSPEHIDEAIESIHATLAFLIDIRQRVRP
jgi:hypothetical protein